jgi:hypothetical protein
MKRSRRYLTWAIAGFFVCASGAGQVPESNPVSRPGATTESEAAIAAALDVIAKDPFNSVAIRKALTAADAKAKTAAAKNQVAALWAEFFARETKADNQRLLDEIHGAVEDPARQAEAAELLERARLVAPSMDASFRYSLDVLAGTLLFNRVKPAFDAAKAKGEAGDPKGALDAHEDLIAFLAKELDRFDVKYRSDVRDLYKGAVSASDKLVEELETPELEAAIPARDLLTAVERGHWGKSAGIELAFDRPGLEIKGVEIPGKKITGIGSVGLGTPPWRDLVMDLQFTLVSGGFDVFLRYAPSARHYMVRFDQSSGYELAKPYHVTLRVKGSKVEMLEADRKPQTDVLSWNTSRTGGIGFGLQPGSKVLISSLTLKVLR